MGENTFAKEKEVFAAALKKAGYTVVDDHGVVVAIAKADEYVAAKTEVEKIAKSVKYDLSYGIRKQQT